MIRCDARPSKLEAVNSAISVYFALCWLSLAHVREPKPRGARQGPHR